MTPLRRLPSPSISVAAVALIMSLGTNVTAAVLITSADIKDDTIRSADVRDGTIRTVDVAESLTGADMANGSLTGADVNESTFGVVPSAVNSTMAQLAGNSATLEGLSANQLVRATRVSDHLIRSLNACAWSPLLSKIVKAPTSGILLAWGSLKVTTGTTAPTTVYLRAVVDGRNFAPHDSATLDAGILLPALTVSGATTVGSGDHVVTLEALECGDGLAKLFDRSMTMLFVPFGNEGQQGTL